MAWVEYQARVLPGSGYIERARDTELRLPVYDDGALAAPSSGTVTIYDSANGEVVSAAAVTVTGSVATYTVSSATVASKAFGSGWRIEWTLVMPDTETHLFRQDASLVRVRLSLPITDLDLLERHSDLDDHLPSGVTTFEGYILTAWRDLLGRLEGLGRRPYLVMDSSAFRLPMTFMALEIVCRDYSAAGDPENTWWTLAEHYRERAREEWSTLTFAYDEDDDGRDDGIKRASGMTTVWLSGRAL